jgi:hypothetical protein
MKIFVLGFISLALVYFSNDPAFAGYAIRGRGANTCGAFIASSDGVPIGKAAQLQWGTREYTSENTLYIEWAYAYITAVILDKDIKNLDTIKDNSSFDLWLRNWCSAHPTNYFIDAVTSFLINEGVLK